MTSPNLTLEEILRHLAEADKPLSSTTLTELSDLDRAEVLSFLKTWRTLSTERRIDIVNRLVEMGEDNFELNYESIFRALLRDESPDVRLTATSGLWESEDPLLINPLIRLMKEDSSEEVQAAAATALGKFAMLAEYKKLRPVYAESIGSNLLGVINDKTKPLEVRRRALEAISPLSFPGVTQAINTFYRSPEIKFKISAVYAMGKSCNISFLPLLKKELLSSDAETRYEAVTALGEMGEEEAIPYLADLFEDPDVDVQMAVIHALGQIGGAQARKHLQTALKSESEATREAAADALDELESEENPFDIREEA